MEDTQTGLDELLTRIADGWTPVRYEGRRYGLSRTTHGSGASISVYAEELGGPDVISTNVFRTSSGDLLRPCEMPAAKVLAFLRGWEPDPSTASRAEPEEAADTGRASSGAGPVSGGDA